MNISCVTLYQNCSNRFAWMNKMAARATNRKKETFKRLLLVNQWMDFEIISHECSLGNPLLKLLKPFSSSEWNDLSNFGRGSPKEYSYEIILKLGKWTWRRCRFKVFLYLARMNKMAARAKIRKKNKNKKNFKHLLLLNQ